MLKVEFYRLVHIKNSKERTFADPKRGFLGFFFFQQYPRSAVFPWGVKNVHQIYEFISYHVSYFYIFPVNRKTRSVHLQCRTHPLKST